MRSGALHAGESASRAGIPWDGAGVTAIRRRSQRGLKLKPDLELIEGDVVVLIGTAEAVTAAEKILLRGVVV